jgi:hypothetical protein
MSEPPTAIRFTARLLRPARPKGVSWTFLRLPQDASARLPTRAMATVDGTLNGYPFQATLEPDGCGGHWLKVGRALRVAAGAAVDEVVSAVVSPVTVEPEPRMPPDLRKAFAAAPGARAKWSNLTAVARRDWIHWITSARKVETRATRIEKTLSMLASGKRRVCCFDRSGIHSKGLSAPEPATTAGRIDIAHR